VSRAALAALLVLATSAPAAAALYRWTADDGTIHYTSELESIPEARRAAAVEIGHPAARPAPPPAAPSPPGAVVPFVRGGAVVVDASLNGVALRLLLDTGADRTVITPAALARAGLDGRGRPVRITSVTGSAAASLVDVPRLDVAGVHVGPLAVIAHAVPDDALDGLLGRDVLDAFTVTFDAAAGRVTLSPR
jgi:predicted aspartyl protease